MKIKTFRAKSIQEALELVRRDLGPNAAILHSREVRPSMLGWLFQSRQIEVAAAAHANVPSRLPQRLRPSQPAVRPVPSKAADVVDHARIAPPIARTPPAGPTSQRDVFRSDKPQVRDSAAASGLDELVENLRQHSPVTDQSSWPESLFHLFTELIDAEVNEELARELIQRVREDSTGRDLADAVMLKARIAGMIESEIRVSGPIEVRPNERRIVALVGSTGVGKTTTIAKLAANFHLRQRRRVGLITVDTYRVAAVDQLRTYADIIDLPMEVVSTPREMRDAIQRLSGVDLILMDTAGRSPRDEVKIQELKSMLGEAQADEVHLVLSSVSSLPSLQKSAERFAEVGVTSLLLTKLDEATGLGNLLPLLRGSHLPLSYLTNGQNVPDDIEAADPQKLARIVLGMQ